MPKVTIYGRDRATNYDGPLIPPDKKQCQFERHEYHPFRCGGDLHPVIRCEAKPTVIATEKKTTRKDRKKGAMSLCDEHRQMLEQSAPDYCTFRKIGRKRKIALTSL